MREYSFSRQGVIDFNFLCFREAIHKVFEVRTTKKCALNDPLYDDDDHDPNDLDGEEEVEDEEDDGHLVDGVDEDLRRYDSDDDDDIKLTNNNRVSFFFRINWSIDNKTIFCGFTVRTRYISNIQFFEFPTTVMILSGQFVHRQIISSYYPICRKYLFLTQEISYRNFILISEING